MTLEATLLEFQNIEIDVHARKNFLSTNLKTAAEIRSAPNSRNSSRKIKRRKASDIDLDEQTCVQGTRKLSRSTSDFIVSSDRKTSITRKRSFVFTSKGILTDTDISRRKSSGYSSASSGRLYSTNSDDSFVSTSTSYFRVDMIGANRVGKTTLINRFMSSEYSSHDIDEEEDRKLNIVIDNEESTIEFRDFSQKTTETYNADAYLVIFSVHDYDSFELALEYLQYLRHELDIDRPIILVANKIDLVRKRQIPSHEARQAAIEYQCKYIETSAVLSHKVDHLLVGLLKQIKLKLSPQMTEEPILCPEHKHSLCKETKSLFNRLFRWNTKTELLPCENLFDL